MRQRDRLHSKKPRHTKTSKVFQSSRRRANQPGRLTEEERYDLAGLVACVSDVPYTTQLDDLKRFFSYLRINPPKQSQIINVVQGVSNAGIFTRSIPDHKRQIALDELHRFTVRTRNSRAIWNKMCDEVARQLGINNKAVKAGWRPKKSKPFISRPKDEPEVGKKKRHQENGKSTLFETWAQEQGVYRPFKVLTNMKPAEREQIAELLGFELKSAWRTAIQHVIVSRDLPATAWPSVKSYTLPLSQAEALLLIGSDLDGIQARSHSAFRTLNLAARNHTWQEILEGVINEFEIEGNIKAVDAMEGAIFEYVAEKALTEMSKEDLDGIERVNNEDPRLAEKLKQAGFGPNGTRLFLAGAGKLISRQGFKAYISAVKFAAGANKRLGMKFAMRNVTKGLKLGLQGLNVLLWAWLAADILNLLFGSSRKRLLPVLAHIRAAALIQQMS
jgi:hypothetical protein